MARPDDTSVRPVTLANTNVNGTTPFWSPEDGANDRLNEAHALLTVMARGYRAAQDAGGAVADEFGLQRHQVTAAALEGIATLIALAMHQTAAALEHRHD